MSWRPIHHGLVLLLAAQLPAAEPYAYANPADERAAYPWLEQTRRCTDQVWRTHYDAKAPLQDYPGTIVSYAGKWTRHQFGGHGGMASNCGWRYANNQFTSKRPWTEIGQLVTDRIDVDGDGQTKDDFVFSLVHSLDVPLGIPDWPFGNVFPERLNGRFYGGATYFCANNTPDKLINFSYEMGINPDHSCFMDTRAEDHPINGSRHKSIPGSFLRHYVEMLWKKEDFLNGGDAFRVSFDDRSRLATFCTRSYWYGWNDVRYVVQDGDQLYISELLPDIPDYAFKDARKLKKPNGYLPVICPTKLAWAEYHPQGYQIDFDAAKASFAHRTFNDVRGVGWYLAKTNDSDAQTHCKWYGFQADAVIRRPRSASPHLDMVEMRNQGTPPFSMARCELPYGLWQDIYRWGDSPWNIIEPRYVYDASGSMGSMAFGTRSHMHDEPLTDLTFYDLLATCNTLSEMEGKEPCYYTDAACTGVFRNQFLGTKASYGDKAGVDVRNIQNPVYAHDPPPTVFVKWSADGHRLPTPAEWMAARGISPATPRTASDGTTPVGAGSPNANGIYDLDGNVWEPTWTFGAAYDPAQDPEIIALGGDFLAGGTVSPYGDRPFHGAGNIGLRLVCRDQGLPAPPGDATLGSIPVLRFRQQTLIAPAKPPSPPAAGLVPVVDLPAGSFVRSDDQKTITVAAMSLGRTEVSYDQWRQVKQWGEAHGYDFDHNGDMGSMYWFDFTHEPSEPVTHITWHDMITWCNALSEMEGRTPCFYADEARTQVIRTAHAYKPIKIDSRAFIAVPEDPSLRYLDANAAEPWIFPRWDVDGYRLPTLAEYEYATRCGTTTRYPWGDDPTQADDYVWGPKNSGGRTHPVDSKKPNAWGIHNLLGLVVEWSFSDEPTDVHGRPYDRDLDNPIASPFAGWQAERSAYVPRDKHVILAGPSFLHGGYNYRTQHGIMLESSASSPASHYYADLGFRVVRCTSGTHPRDGLRPLAAEPIQNLIHIDAKTHVEFGQ